MSVTEQTITERDFNDAVPASLRAYVHVASIPLPGVCIGLLDAFRTAMSSLENKVRVVRPLEVIVAKAPFNIVLGNGTLTYTPKTKDVINVHIDDRIILLDAEKMLPLPKALQVACILEEFAHAIMNISDEGLVSDVVALLYHGVVIVDGKYVPRAAS